ncbi:hypothetical protein [Hamadaea tsunoensis]|uniref:hypothetical protein n=1 Tax=Hamadaea tsunoensis TaxID=53368 RepID=UPI0003F7F991|nr:hypothetical protein [Hamadaea tsunoensis]
MRRIATVLAAATLAVVGLAGPAHAATVDLPEGPLSIGDYCHAQVSSAAWIGFYESSGLRCYSSGTGGSLVYQGTGDAYLACKYLTTDVVMAALHGASNSLICRVIR